MEDDMILPEGFEMDTPSTEEPAVETEQPEPEVEDTTPTDEPVDAQEPPVQPFKLKVKYNSQELEIDPEEAAVLAQKGMNYEKAIERARQESAQQAKDALIAEMGYTWNGKPITTEAEYKAALAEQKIIEQYKDRDLPQEVIDELLASRRDREERQREKAENDKAAQNAKMWNDFFALYKEVEGRPFDINTDKLPQEVEQAIERGETPRIAYMEYHNRELRNQLKIAKQNQANSKKAPVSSVTAGGSRKTESEDLFLKGFNSTY